ncbi:MAG: hypothetical protein ACK45H_07620, partial [Bacteroidota bacterium]
EDPIGGVSSIQSPFPAYRGKWLFSSLQLNQAKLDNLPEGLKIPLGEYQVFKAHFPLIAANGFFLPCSLIKQSLTTFREEKSPSQLSLKRALISCGE